MEASHPRGAFSTFGRQSARPCALKSSASAALSNLPPRGIATALPDTRHSTSRDLASAHASYHSIPPRKQLAAEAADSVPNFNLQYLARNLSSIMPGGSILEAAQRAVLTRNRTYRSGFLPNSYCKLKFGAESAASAANRLHKSYFGKPLPTPPEDVHRSASLRMDMRASVIPSASLRIRRPSNAAASSAIFSNRVTLWMRDFDTVRT